MLTFVTFIGKGRKKNDVGPFDYQQGTYQFPQGELFSGQTFPNVVIESKKYPIDKVLVIGSETSSWAALLPNTQDNEDLFLQIDDLTNAIAPDNAAGLKQNSAEAAVLQERLSKCWGKPVHLLIHPAEPDERIWSRYFFEITQIKGKILVDVTHALRWMPLLLTTTLQGRAALGEENNIEIIYGEFIDKDSAMPVKILSTISQGQKIVQSIATFFEKFEARPLADDIRPFWSSGADALERLGKMLQGNFLLPLTLNKDDRAKGPGQVLNQLHNALIDYDKLEHVPEWSCPVVKKIKRIWEKLALPTTCSERLLELAQLYSERYLYGQALICQEVALRMWIWEQQHKATFPTWDDLKTCKKREYDKLHMPNFSMGKTMKIFQARNMVAHGALATGDENISVPESNNLPDQFESHQKYLRKLIMAN